MYVLCCLCSHETISEQYSNTMEVKRSKFIATVWPVTSAEQVIFVMFLATATSGATANKTR